MSQDENIRLSDLLSTPAAAAVLDKYLPGISSHPMIPLIQSFTLQEIASYPQTNLSSDKVRAILAEFKAQQS